MDKPVKGPDGMRAANGKLFLTENGAGKIDMVTVGGDAASITVLQEGLATPTAIEPAADTLWYGERAGDRARSMRLPNIKLRRCRPCGFDSHRPLHSRPRLLLAGSQPQQ